MAVMKEMVLYYQPEKDKQGGNLSKSAMMKAVLVRLGIRIKNITEEQAGETVGYLAGYEDFEEAEKDGCSVTVPQEEMLVMKSFTSKKIDEMLAAFRKAGIPKIELKAVITDTNKNWTFCQLYEELKKEHDLMTKKEES